MISLTTFQSLLRKRPRPLYVTLTQKWLETHEELGVGQVSGDKRLYLSLEDHERLEAEYERLTNGASLGMDLSQDRVALAKYVDNEKASTRQVFSGFVRVGSDNGSIHTASDHQDLTLPRHSYLAIREVEILQLDAYARVLIVENGAMMENLEGMQAILPEAYRERTLYVYRGHDRSAEGVRKIIKGLAPEQTLGLFCDYDPAGLDIAGHYLRQRPACRVEMLAPDDPEALVKRGSEDLYLTQLGDIDLIKRRLDRTPGMVKHLDAIRRAKKGLTQEAMLAHGINLESEII